MVKATPKELTMSIQDIRKEIASLSDRLARLETRTAPTAPPTPPAAPLAAKAAAPPVPEPAPGITQEELLAISGALAAYFGVRVHIRQIRLTGSRAWAQQGRVSIQASHRLHT
jgi:methylmalonyl-CoA carboxyltransferase large subunit